MQSNRAGAWVPLLTLWLVTVLLAGCGSAREAAEPSTAPAPDTRAGPGTRPVARSAGERPVVEALRVLRRWDGRRAAAYAAGDRSALRRLYAPASRAGARDVRLLTAYADRGLVVEGMTVQVLRVELVTRSPTLVRLRVVDRLTGATAVPVGMDAAAVHGVSLPSGRPVARLVTMVRDGSTWVVRSVRPAPG